MFIAPLQLSIFELAQKLDGELLVSMPRVVLESIIGKLVDRYCLADTVFRVFGGNIGSARPPEMPAGEWENRNLAI